MKYIKYILLIIITCVFSNVYANTCSYKEQTILNNDLVNVKVLYEIVNDREINILIYNITENIYITFTDVNNKKETIYFSNTDNGKYILKRNAVNLEEYEFQIRSNLTACYGNILTTKKIVKPKYNEYHELEICNNEKLANHSYCQKFVTREINKTEDEVIKILEEFLAVKVEKITTNKIEENEINIKNIITYTSLVLIIGIILVIFLLIKKKRGEL